jgi:hypothetical protein
MADNEHLDATPEELLAAEQLRKALEGESSHDDADFLRSLKAAHDPAPLDARTNDALIERALAKAPAKKREGVVIRVAFGAAAVLAMAAALLLVFGKIVPTATPAEKPELARVRSTAPLFDHPFDSKETSVRVDRIAMARASDLRENRFAQWGVR